MSYPSRTKTDSQGNEWDESDCIDPDESAADRRRQPDARNWTHRHQQIEGAR